MKPVSRFGKFVVPLALVAVSGCVAVVEDRPRREVVMVDSDRHGPPPWAPAHGWRRKHETFHYYPVVQVYYFPSNRTYYWLDAGEWKVGVRLPSRYVIEQHKMVVVELDDEPHKRHHKVKTQYPPDYFEKGKGKGKGRS